jgi:hypothetical protein
MLCVCMCMLCVCVCVCKGGTVYSYIWYTAIVNRAVLIGVLFSLLCGSSVCSLVCCFLCCVVVLSAHWCAAFSTVW